MRYNTVVRSFPNQVLGVSMVRVSLPRPVVSLAAALSILASCAAQSSPMPAPTVASPAATRAPTSVIAWRETFDRATLDWVTPVGSQADSVSKVFSLRSDVQQHFLHAHHDARPEGDVPPAVHYGKSFAEKPLALSSIRQLRWKWRVHQHPDSAADPWKDLAASVYVVVRTPGFLPGRGFKFGWVAAPAPADTTQRGLLQIALRTGPPLDTWEQESVDLCALYQRAYGSCDGENVLYVGVVTDADNTRSVADADYADFELEVADGSPR